MAAVDTPPRIPEVPVLQRGRRTGRARPARGLELWSWLFMRLSGIVLLVLAVGHVLIMHVLDKGVDRVNFQFVAVRWGSPFWKTWDWLMLSLALLHGINGLRVISLDYLHRPALRAATNIAFYVIGIGLFALGTDIVVTFSCAKFGVTC